MIWRLSLSAPYSQDYFSLKIQSRSRISNQSMHVRRTITSFSIAIARLKSCVVLKYAGSVIINKAALMTHCSNTRACL